MSRPNSVPPAVVARAILCTLMGTSIFLATDTARARVALYLRDDFESYASLDDAVKTGVWHSHDGGGAGSHGLATLLDSTGKPTKAYFMTVVENEDSYYLEFRFPGSVNGDDSTGVDHFFVQWKEKRSERFDFGAEKTCRAFGRSADDNVTLDVIVGITNDNDGFGRDSVVSDSATVSVFGQGRANDSTYFDAALEWNRDKWYTIEWEVRLNTVGRSDGQTKLWLNGVEVGSRRGLAIRKARDTYTFHGIRIGGWESGGRPVAPATRYIDDVVISDTYIGSGR